MSSQLASQLNDLRSYSRHWLGEFIDLYQTEECLWQPKHPDYSNNTVRNKAYDKLVEKLKEVEPNPDRNMVVRKINSLRSAFRREYRKTSANQNYETRLWYYDKLSFIADQSGKRSITSLGAGGGNNSGSDVKPQKRSLTLAFEEEDSMEFEDEHQMDASSAHSASQADLQNDPGMSATIESEVVPVSIVKTEDHKLHQHQQQHVQQQQQQHEPPPLHHHHHQQHHHHHAATAAQQLHTQTQPQHTTAVKVLEITSLDSNSQREIQQAVNSLEQQHQIQQQLQQHQQQQNGNAAAQLTQIHQQVPTIQIAREHLQPLFGSTATAYTTTTTGSGNPRSEDEFDAIGMNVASKLRVMNTHQRIIAEKLISDVLFNAQLDNLNVNSHLSQ